MTVDRLPLRLLAVLAIVVAVAPGGAEEPLARALAEQRQRAESAPFDPTVQNDLGNLLALAGESEAAEAAYRSALAADPEFATAHYNLGRLLSRQGHLWAARRELKRALAIEPDNADAHYHLGVVYAGWGFDRLARRAYARAFRLDPSLAEPQRNPHVLENRLALAAQLMAWEAERAPGPTRQYEDAASIASQARLAAPPPAAPAVDAAPAATEGSTAPLGGGFAHATGAPGVEPRTVEPAPADPPSRAARAPGAAKTPSAPPPGGATSSGSTPMVLGAGDLRGGGTVNQVSPGATDRGRRPTAGGPQAGNQPSRFRPSRVSTSRIESGLELADPAQRAIGS